MKHSARFKEYVWEKCIAPQLGYSFNLAHGVAYSLIGLQEVNLATQYNPLYWACANLCVAAGLSQTQITDDDMEDEDLPQEEVEQEEEEDSVASSDPQKKKKNIAPNYVKIATAIAQAQAQGVEIVVPNINTSERDFTPDVEHNAILYGLGAVVGVNEDFYNKIIENRPYHKVSEFIQKVEPTKTQMVNLIKAGCFDSLMTCDRKTIMNTYLYFLATEKIKKKEKMTITQLKNSLDMGIDFGKEWEFQIFLYKYKAYIDKNQYDAPNKRYLLDDDDCKRYFTRLIEFRLQSKDVFHLPDDVIAVKKSAFSRLYNEEKQKIIDYMNTEEFKDTFYKAQLYQEIEALSKKYAQGSIAAWEMETLSYYHEPHELIGINKDIYNVVDFSDLPESPDSYTEGTGCVLGTVIGFENGKHLVYLLTTKEVVTVKFFGNNYVKYNKRISELVPNGTKKPVKVVIDESWFKRGTKLLIYGQRRENMFLARRGGRDYPMVCLVEEIKPNGRLVLRSRRKE